PGGGDPRRPAPAPAPGPVSPEPPHVSDIPAPEEPDDWRDEPPASGAMRHSSPGDASGPGSPRPSRRAAGREAAGGSADVPPFPDDEDFDPDDEGTSVPVTAEVSGVALIQRELGAEIIGEYDH
ncbi:MAG: hypothetical protein J2P25_15380, partial [Nocardiopsaceae bacterium]|nr:hypothetical protein [Nocardiopsaceae bacterium]